MIRRQSMKRGGLAVPFIPKMAVPGVEPSTLLPSPASSLTQAWCARLGLFVASGLFVLASFGASSARADDDELELMNEPTTFTDVADAFDGRDPFDLDVTIAFVRTMEFGRIQRERGTSNWRNIGDYSRETNELQFGLDIGIYRDLMIYARLPLVLSDDRGIERANGVDPAPFLTDPQGSLLFGVPSEGFRAPTRSGVDRIEVGAAWAVLNQFRDRNVPTWVLRLEGHFNLGSPMIACSQTATSNCSGNIGRGVYALKIETRASNRYDLLEPYAGFSIQVEWAGMASDSFAPGGPLPGYGRTMPPVVAGFTLGTAIIAWEDRAQWQRFAIDARWMVNYFSAGRDYSPLFDTLGASANPYLSTPMPEGRAGDIGAGETAGLSGLRQVGFTGLTETQERASVGGRLTIELRAARYVRFGLSADVAYTPTYLLTQTPACNSGADSTGDPRLRGGCLDGIVDPQHRAIIDLPGNRFRIEGLTRIDLMASATAQF